MVWEVRYHQGRTRFGPGASPIGGLEDPATGAPLRRSYRGPWPRRFRAGRMHRLRLRRTDNAKLSAARTAVAALYPRARFGTPAALPGMRQAREGSRVDQVGRELARRLRPEARGFEPRTKG